MLRPYQKDAAEAAIKWMRRCIEPALLELATGSGKSHIVAELAAWLHGHTGKKVLCIQPSKELTEQNHAKLVATGMPASIYSASAGRKETRHGIVYGTPGTVVRNLDLFGSQYAAVIADEAHGITPTMRTILAHMRERNPALRIMGMSATPYRTRTGYIYRYGPDGEPVEDAIDPYFNTLLYRVTAPELIAQGYLTPVTTQPGEDHYDAARLEVNARGQFDADEVAQVFEGHGRKTARIVADVVARSSGRNGVMLFAQTVRHAQEIMASLPPEQSAMIGGDINMRRADREALLESFKAQRVRYLVSIGTLTTGFDAPHVDVIAVLRATESAGLFQQIIGRGLRLSPGKGDCLLLDYAENVERHQLHDDLFAPRITARAEGEAEKIPARCEVCDGVNRFGARPNPDGFPVDDAGYFTDLKGERLMGDHGPTPAHYGRRCELQTPGDKPGTLARCGGRWTSKKCPECDADNDIAARQCASCRAEIVDPNDRLRMEFARIKADPFATHTDEVLRWEAAPTVTSTGRISLKITARTPYRTVDLWMLPDGRHPEALEAWRTLCDATIGARVANADRYMQARPATPKTITYRKDRISGFFRLIALNREIDRIDAKNA